MKKTPARNLITPGLYAIGDIVRPLHPDEFGLYGYGRIAEIAVRKNGNPYKIEFLNAKVPLFFREDEFKKKES